MTNLASVRRPPTRITLTPHDIAAYRQTKPAPASLLLDCSRLLSSRYPKGDMIVVYARETATRRVPVGFHALRQQTSEKTKRRWAALTHAIDNSASELGPDGMFDLVADLAAALRDDGFSVKIQMPATVGSGVAGVPAWPPPGTAIGGGGGGGGGGGLDRDAVVPDA